jgi:hypothetical protein
MNDQTVIKPIMKKLKHHVDAYIKLLTKGHFAEVIDVYYHPEITQIENYDPPVVGKERLRQIELDNLDRIAQVNCKVLSYAVNEKNGLVMGEMYIEFTSKRLGKMLLEEAFVQKWKDGKILYKRFYYKDFQHLLGFNNTF